MNYCPKCGEKLELDANFCPDCGAQLDNAKEKTDKKSNEVNNQVIESIKKDEKSSQKEPGLTIEFGYSTSRNYDMAVKTAKKYSTYNKERGEQEDKHSVTIPFEEVNEIFNLVDLIFNWKTAKFFIGDKEVLKRDFNSPLRCYRDRTEAYDPEKYCYGDESWNFNIWGCKKLRMPFNEREARTGWLSYGQFDKNNKWVFNKDKIKHQLMKHLSNFKICPALDKKEIKQKFDNLPSVIDINKNNNWNIIYDYKNTENGYAKVPIGVTPNLDSSASSYNPEATKDISFNVEAKSTVEKSQDILSENKTNKADDKLEAKKNINVKSKTLDKQKENGKLKKFGLVLLMIFLPPIGIFPVILTGYFKTFGKIISVIWLVFFLIALLA